MLYVTFDIGHIQVVEVMRLDARGRILAVTRSRMYRSIVSNMQDLFDGLFDENEGYQAGKILLSEPSDVANKGRSVRHD